MSELPSPGDIVTVIYYEKRFTGRIIKQVKNGEMSRVRYYNSELEHMRIDEFYTQDLIPADEQTAKDFLEIARAHNIKLNLSLSSEKRKEANSRRFD